jgi:hypothetical protein
VDEDGRLRPWSADALFLSTTTLLFNLFNVFNLSLISLSTTSMALELNVAEAKRSTDPVSKNWGVLSQPMRALIRSMRLRRRFGAGLSVLPSPGARRSIPKLLRVLENLAIGFNQIIRQI